MKKKLIISCILALVLCVSMFTACNGTKLSVESLQAMFDSLDRKYSNASGTTTESYDMPALVTYVNDGSIEECDVLWTVEGSELVTVSEKNEETQRVTINVPAVRESAINYTLKGSLVDEKGNVYKDGDGKEFTLTLTRVAPKTNKTEAANAEFNSKIVKTPTAGTAYKLATWKLQEMLYFSGKTVSATTTYRYATVKKYADAPDVFTETTDGGFYLYFMNGTTKTYIDLFSFNANSGSTAFVTDKAQLKGVYSVHETGALVTTTKLNETDTTSSTYYLSIRNKYPGQISANAVKYLTDSYNSYRTTEHAMYLINGEPNMPAQENLTEAQILEKLGTLGENEEMYGRYSLTGVVTTLGTYNSNFFTQTITIKVGETVIEGYNLYVSNAGKDVAVGDKIKITGVLTNYSKDGNSKFEFVAGSFFEIVEKGPGSDTPIVLPSTEHAGTLADPYSVADAGKIAAVLGSKLTEEAVYVKGIITSMKDPSQGEYNFDIVDANGDTVKCIIYWTTSSQAPAVGDTVVVKGWLTQYNGSAEIAKKDTSNKPVIVSINGQSIA